MAENTNTLAGLLLLNDQNMSDIYPNDVLDAAPVMKLAHAQPASQGGTQHKYLKRITAAGAGFRKVARGIDNAAEEFDDITLNCELLDGSFDRDVAKARAYRKGVEAYLQRETGAALGSAMFQLERAMFQIGIAHQFYGLPLMEDYWETDSGQVIDVAGSGGRSIWLVRWGEDAVSVIAGNEGNLDLVVPSEDNIVRIEDSEDKPYSAYRTTLLGWFGLQVGSKYDVVRICNIDGSSGKKATDDLLYEGLSKFPSGRPANMIIMNRTSLKEVRENRTGTNPTGTPAPFPTDLDGIPIVTTDALSDSEALVNSSSSPATVTTA
jgi:hypothetical protein